jgi:hypothetical protein
LQDGSERPGVIEAGDPSATLDDLERGRIDHAGVGSKLGTMLQHAHDWAGRTVADAEAEAMRIREKARAAARRMILEAESEAERIKADAEAEAEARIRFAESRLEELREAADMARGRAEVLRRRLVTVADQLQGVDDDLELPQGALMSLSAEEIPVDDIEVDEPEEAFETEADDARGRYE